MKVCSTLKFGLIVLLFASVAQAQSIDISKFYYRYYLDFGQGYGAFNGENSGKANTSNGTTLTGKDGTQVSVPNVPNFSASSNYGSLTSVGRGFAVTANHVKNAETADNTRKFGLTDYQIANQPIGDDNKPIYGISGSYGWDSKFLRFNKYIVEGQAELLNTQNSLLPNADETTKKQNLTAFENELEKLKDNGKIYLYQAGSGEVMLYSDNKFFAKFNLSNGEIKGGGFGTLEAQQYGKCNICENTTTQGIVFNYVPDKNFKNVFTKGDSGSGVYAFDKNNNQWILLGVVSQTYIQIGGDEGKVSFVSKKDLEDYQKNFEKSVNLNSGSWTISGLNLNSNNDSWQSLDNNKDIIFSGGGNVEVKSNVDRMQSGYAGGFVFADAQTQTTYKFTNEQGKNYSFKGSGLDIGENVVVEWALGTQKGDSLHKIGKGELKITDSKGDNGTLKIGEGKVTLDTTTKAFENIYITSGRGELALKKAEALGAEKNGATSATSYTLTQESTDKMGFYFGKGGGKFDLAGNSLVLNTIAANDSKAIITNSNASTQSTLEIQGYGYTDNKKTNTKADTIIHASIGDNTSTNGTNIDIVYKSDDSTKNADAHLIFDGNINTSGKLSTENSNIALQGHATAHATISDKSIIDKIKTAESGTSKGMPNYMDLSKPSHLEQPDWDDRIFKFAQGITLTNSALTLGRNSYLESDITADSSSTIKFGGSVKHFIDNKDGKNVTGSGFSYQQEVESGNLSGKSLEGANETISYKGKITATGGTIESHILNFNASLDLQSGAKLSADFLTLTNADSVTLASGASASIKALRLKDINNDLSSKFTLGDDTKFEVKESFIFDKSTFNLDNLKTTTINNLTLPTAYNLYAFNGSTITATNFTNSKENAQFIVQNSSFKADKITFEKNAFMTLDKGNLTLQNNLQSANLDLNLLNSSAFTGDIVSTEKINLNLDKASTLNAKTLTSNGVSTINLNNKATLTLENALSSKDLTLTLKNESNFKAQTLTASGVVNLQGDKNATLTLETLNLNGANTANLSGVKSTISTLNLTQKSQANIGENVSITTLNLTDSTANLELLNGQIPKTIDLKTNSTLRLNELNLNDFSTNSLNLKSDETSQAHIKRLIYDAKSTQTNGASKIPQSNLIVSEKFELKNVGQNLGTTQGTQNTPSAEKEKLEKDLFTLKFEKNLELKNGAKLDISFADKVTNNENLLFNQNYTIFTAGSLIYGDNLDIRLNLMGAGNDFFAKGEFDKNKNAFFVQFVRENPRNFSKLNPYINPAHSPLLEILLQHNKNDASIDKAVNMSDYTALNQRLAQIDTSLKTIANADSAALKTLPLLQKQEINARIQQNRFTTAKFALAKITNPAQKSDIVPTLLYLDENERQNRVWSGASASFFGNGSDKFSLQSVSIGYDRKLFGDEFLLGILASLTNTQLSSDETSLNPKIYTLALYSDALFRHGELQNELSFSLLNGDKGFESENGSYKSFYGFFESVYKVQTAFLPQSIKPIVLGRVNLRHFDEFSTATYKQKADDDISVDLGVGVEWLWQKESGFYSASFVAERDIYHSQKERLMSLTGAQKFVAYETNEPSFAYQLYLAGLENFKNGIYLRYGLSGFVDSKAYKGFKADVQVGYRF